MSQASELAPTLNVGLIATNLDHDAAWIRGKGPPMSCHEAAAAVEEVKFALQCFRQRQPHPDLILIPELSVPRARVDMLRHAAKALRAVIIAGVDYRFDRHDPKLVHNEAIVYIPPNWSTSRIGGGRVSEVTVAKSEPAHGERGALEGCGLKFATSSVFLLFKGSQIGDFGVSVCSDFLDLDRAAAYRGRIQHLFVVAYNQDIESFRHTAECLARTIYCNVVVCNTAFYGGSVGIAPLHEPWKRVIYHHAGGGLFTHQVISIPVAPIAEAQSGNTVQGFKALPPRFPIAQTPMYLQVAQL